MIQGIVNKVKMEYGHLDEDSQKEIARRLLICEGCPYLSKNAVNIPALNYKTDRKDDHCILCGCNKELKTASLDSNCGAEVYNKTDMGKKYPIELKWTKYEKPKENGIQ